MPQLSSIIGPVDRSLPRRTCHCHCHILGEHDKSDLWDALKEFHCNPGQVCCEHYDKAWPQTADEPIPGLLVNEKKFRLACHWFQFATLMLELYKKFEKKVKIVEDTDQLFDRLEIQAKKPEPLMRFINKFCQKNKIAIQEMSTE